MEISFYKKENTRDNYYVLYLFSCETQIAEIVGFLGVSCVYTESGFRDFTCSKVLSIGSLSNHILPA